jgi:putative oxidoreductase
VFSFQLHPAYFDMKKLISTTAALHGLRASISVAMMMHGGQRLYYGTVNGFGEFLNTQGFFIGVPLAWGITGFELAAGLLLLLNRFTKWITLIWAAQLLMGIVLVHARNGWYVVGPSTNGVEYSLLLIAALLVLHSQTKD